MLVASAKNNKGGRADGSLVDLLNRVSAETLFSYVEKLAFPRHYVAERQGNHRARDLIRQSLQGFGYEPVLHGRYDNVVATTGDAGDKGYLLLGAHYDSVPGTPGADDNGSAVSACLECARLVKTTDAAPTMFVFFNREEDGLLGSAEFVKDLHSHPEWQIAEAHILEMVGYCARGPGSQRMPPGLPGVGLIAPDVGDFLGLLANRDSNSIAEMLLELAATYLSPFPVIALKTYLGVEKDLSHLQRSDHSPFWEAGIPSLMWTDTAEFRNPHYHQVTDTPETLDYDFLVQVAKLALARVMSRSA